MRSHLTICLALFAAVVLCSGVEEEDEEFGWLLLANSGFSLTNTTESNAHLRRDWLVSNSLSLTSEQKDVYEASWRASILSTHLFVAPSFNAINKAASLSTHTPLLMRALEGRLWIAKPLYSAASPAKKVECHAARNELNLIKMESMGKGALELWEGDRAHEMDGGDCYEVVLVFTNLTPKKSSSPPAAFQNYFDKFLSANGAAGDQRIHDLVSRVNETRLKETVEKLSSFHSRQSTSAGAKEAQQFLFDTYTSLGLSVSTYGYIDAYSQNVIAELPSNSQPQKFVIVSGHYDSRAVNSSDPSLRAPGADDNGTGTAAALELARVIVESGLEFEYSIRFCAWSGEEQGLRGSAAYAKEMREKGVEIVAVFNGDMLGFNREGTALTLGMKDLYITPWLLQVANTITSVYVPDLTIASSASCCSDHQSFFENGFPAIGYFESKAGASDYPNYHQITDTPDKVHFGLHRRITSAMLGAVATMAVPLPM